MIHSVQDRAERLSRQRANAAVVLGILLIATQQQRMDHGVAGPVSWALTGTAAAIFLLWASGIFKGRALRGILNDEGSDLNRRRSISIAFWNMIATAVVCYLLTFVKSYSPRDAIQLILTVGMSSALIAFGVSERFLFRR